MCALCGNFNHVLSTDAKDTSGNPTGSDPVQYGTDPNGASTTGFSTLISQYYDGHYHFSGNPDIDAALIGSKWASFITNFSYSFPTSGSYYVGYTTGENTTGFSAFNAAQQNSARYAFGLISQYVPLIFTEITETSTTHAIHRFANTTAVGSAYGNFPSDWFAAGDKWFNLGQPYYSTAQIGNWGAATIMHEIGHTMGLKHGHQDYTFVDLSGVLHVSGSRFGTEALPSSHDGQAYSLMTYRGWIGQTTISFQGDAYNQPQTYMQDDIAALQYLYGANYNTNSGDTTYTFSITTGEMFVNGVSQGVPTANIVFRTVWDGGGNDTYDLSNYTTPLSIDLRPGAWLNFDISGAAIPFQRANNGPLDSAYHFAPGNVANALLYNNNTASLIENAIGGSGNDTITGNQAGNVLTGNGGGDYIYGLGGNDTIYGNDGNDFLYGGDNDDWLVGGAGQDYLDGGNGYDAVDYSANTTDVTINLILGTASFVGFSYAETLVGIEEVLLGSGNDWFYGNSLTNEVFAGAGDDHISSGGGTDYLYGQSGTDWAILSGNSAGYTVVSVSGTQVILNGLDGYDTYLDVEWFQFLDQTIWWQDLGNEAPVVTASDYAASKGQVINASSLFSASDADGDTLMYFFYDNTPAAGSGYFTVNGVVQPANLTFAVTAAQLAQTTFHAGSTSSDDLFVNVYDGVAWSGPKEFHVNVPPNNAPVATAPDYSASSGQVIDASSLFSASDVDGDTLMYFFYDNTPGAGSGYFTVDGVVKPAGVTFAVTAAQLAQTAFHAGSTGSDDLFVNVYDGFAWSGPKEFHVNVAASVNHAPVANAPDYSASSGQVINASSLFSASDPDGDPLLYFFYDNTPSAGSGYFTVDGVVKPAGVTFAVTAAQLEKTAFHAGSAGSDDLFVNVYDGSAWSGPKEFHVNVVAAVNHSPAATATDYSASDGEVINASSLFSASDPDGDTLLYFFYDNTPDAASGYFTVNGTAKPAGITFAVSAAELAQTAFHAGTVADDLFVNVYDSLAWSGPQEFHVL